MEKYNITIKEEKKYISFEDLGSKEMRNITTLLKKGENVFWDLRKVKNIHASFIGLLISFSNPKYKLEVVFNSQLVTKIIKYFPGVIPFIFRCIIIKAGE